METRTTPSSETINVTENEIEHLEEDENPTLAKKISANIGAGCLATIDGCAYSVISFSEAVTLLRSFPFLYNLNFMKYLVAVVPVGGGIGVAILDFNEDKEIFINSSKANI